VTAADMQALQPDQARLSVILNDAFGIIDDCMLTRRADHVYWVINAGCRDKDLAHLRARLAEFKAKGGDCDIHEMTDRALYAISLPDVIGLSWSWSSCHMSCLLVFLLLLLLRLHSVAIQGPEAAAVVQTLLPKSVDLKQQNFMTAINAKLAGVDDCIVSRCGYTGEVCSSTHRIPPTPNLSLILVANSMCWCLRRLQDGFEISIPATKAAAVCSQMIADARVLPAGLGARDSLRLEAGLCLYGHDLNEDITPLEAGLLWTITKRCANPRHPINQSINRCLLAFTHSSWTLLCFHIGISLIIWFDCFPLSPNQSSRARRLSGLLCLPEADQGGRCPQACRLADCGSSS
jgi:aminomethyltransferase